MDRRRMMMTKKLRLPSEYQEVEWIMSSGQQYINPLTYMTEQTQDGYSLICDMKFNTNDYYYFGEGIYYISSAPGKLRFAPGINGAARVEVILSPLERHLLEADWYNKIYKVDGETVATNNGSVIRSGMLLLFAYGHHEGVGGYSQNTLWSARIKLHDTLIRNFIPCYRKSDGVIGLYDLCGSICPLTGTPFYINAGTGTFTKGADVN